MEKVLKILPLRIKEEILRYDNLSSITEIRLRVGKKLHIFYGCNEQITSVDIVSQDLICILKNVSSNSIYSVQQDINNGFVSIEGGHRIGIVGEVVLGDGKVKNIKNISSMNIRIAREYIGVSDKIIDKIFYNNSVNNTIILSPPLCGKTTLLRDVIRKISDGGKNVTVVDERGEVAPMTSGETTLNLGIRTDVISYVPKAIGMQMAVRSMAPEVVCTDEIGTEDDILAIKYLCRSGVNFVTTMHGETLKDIMQSNMKELIDAGYVDTVIVLSKRNGIGTVEKVYEALKENKEGVM